MLSRLDAKSRFVHWEVAILIRAKHIVRLEAFVQTVFGPHPANRAGSFQQEHIVAGIDLAVGLDGGEPTPTYWPMLVSEIVCDSEDSTYLRLPQQDPRSPLLKTPLFSF